MTLRDRHGTRTHRTVVGWAVLAAALAAGGCGSSSDDASSQRTFTAPATTTTATPTTGGGERTGRSTKTTTTPRSEDQGARSPRAPQRATTTPAEKAGRSTPAKLGKPQTFSGNGDRVIGNLVLKRNAVVRWTVTGGGAFTVRDAGNRLKISGRGTSGQTFAEAGDYRSVKVSASGRWTLSFATLGA